MRRSLLVLALATACGSGDGGGGDDAAAVIDGPRAVDGPATADAARADAPPPIPDAPPACGDVFGDAVAVPITGVTAQIVSASLSSDELVLAVETYLFVPGVGARHDVTFAGRATTGDPFEATPTVTVPQGGLGTLNGRPWLSADGN